MIKIKRAYLEPEAGDGTRILVDRLWPRGLTKEKARIDLWLNNVAPNINVTFPLFNCSFRIAIDSLFSLSSAK